MSELKPCPFCGGEAYMITHRFYQLSNTYGVECLDCHAQTYQLYATEQKAQEAWNRREKTYRKCGDCADFEKCKKYVDADETFPEVIGGCPVFTAKEERTNE